jgi:hypothetical protein
MAARAKGITDNTRTLTGNQDFHRLLYVTVYAEARRG